MVTQKDSENNIVAEFNSVSHAAKVLNIKRDLILRCCNGKQKTAKGFIFNYK